MIPASKEILTTLIHAREYLNKTDWCQKAYRDGDAVCTIGALAMSEYYATSGSNPFKDLNPLEDVTFSDPDTHYAVVLAESSDACAYLGDRIPDGFAISTWNDMAGRTKQEVLALYDVAIQDCKNALRL